MAHIDELITHLDELLDPAAFRDSAPNGLQVPGRTEIGRVVTGVSAHRELIDRALALRADLLLVHHGLFWDSQPTGLSPTLAERLRPLMRNDVNLAAYHLPLDGHPEVGNNALLALALGCEVHEPFGEYRGTPVGRAGRLPGDGVPIAELTRRVAEVCGQEPLLFDGGPERVRSIGIVSGAGAGLLPEAVHRGLDALLTGEPREHVMGDAREAGIHFIAAGHYATETFGVRALGDRLEREFGVEHTFVDVPNPV
jgi:dinuclear metal center YbgI/SA1388 family protein